MLVVGNSEKLYDPAGIDVATLPSADAASTSISRTKG